MAGLTAGRAFRALLVPAFILCGAATSSRALAQGATDYPIPSSAHEAYSPIGEGFTSPIEPREDLRGPSPYVDERAAELEAKRRSRLPNAPAFFRDTDLRVNSRTYLFDEDQFGLNEPEALTTGGWLAYQSGAIADVLQLRGVLYTTQPLYANADAGDTDNLSPDGDQITTLGQRADQVCRARDHRRQAVGADALRQSLRHQNDPVDLRRRGAAAGEQGPEPHLCCVLSDALQSRGTTTSTRSARRSGSRRTRAC